MDDIDLDANDVQECIEMDPTTNDDAMHHDNDALDDQEVEEDVDIEHEDVDIDDVDSDHLDKVVASPHSCFTGHNNQPVYAIALIPLPHTFAADQLTSGNGGDVFTVCSGGGDDRAVMWSPSSADTIAYPSHQHADSVIHIVPSHDASLIAAASMDGSVSISSVASSLFQPSNNHHVTVLEASDEIVSICWHPRGPVLTAGIADGSIYLWNAPKNVVMAVWAGHHAAPVSVVTFSNDGKTLFSASQDGSILAWDPKSGSVVWRFTRPDTHRSQYHEEDEEEDGVPGVVSMSAHEEGQVLAVGYEDGFVAILHAPSGRLLHSLSNHSDSVESVTFSSSFFVTASLDASIHIYSLPNFHHRHHVSLPSGISHTLPISTHHAHLCVCATTSGQVHIIDVRTGEVVHEYTTETESPIVSMDVRHVSGGAVVAVGYDDGRAVVFH